MREPKSLILHEKTEKSFHEKYRKSYRKNGVFQCLPNFCPLSPILTQFAGVLKIFAKCPQFLPNDVCGQISDFFRYVSSKNELE